MDCFKYMYAYFLGLLQFTYSGVLQFTCLWQFVKFMILSMLRTHIHDLSRPQLPPQNTIFIKIGGSPPTLQITCSHW